MRICVLYPSVYNATLIFVRRCFLFSLFWSLFCVSTFQMAADGCLWADASRGPRTISLFARAIFSLIFFFRVLRPRLFALHPLASGESAQHR